VFGSAGRELGRKSRLPFANGWRRGRASRRSRRPSGSAMARCRGSRRRVNYNRIALRSRPTMASHRGERAKVDPPLALLIGMVSGLTGTAIQDGFRDHEDNSVVVAAHQLHLLARCLRAGSGADRARLVICAAAVPSPFLSGVSVPPFRPGSARGVPRFFQCPDQSWRNRPSSTPRESRHMPLSRLR
jgi:hypothetical protein